MFGLVTCILLIFVTILIYKHLQRKANYWQTRGVNGPKAYPLVGNLLDNITMVQNDLEEYRLQKYGKIYGVMQGSRPVLTIGDPELLKQMMITDFPVFMNHRDNFVDDPFFGRMLTELKDDEWRRVRATLSPAFTTAKLKAMQPFIDECIQNTFHYLDSCEKRGEEVDIKRVTLAYTLDVIAKCVFGVNTNASENPFDAFVVNAYNMANFPLWRLFTKVIVPGFLQKKYDLQILPQKLVTYFALVLKDAIEKRREQIRLKTNKVDFLTLLLNAECKEDTDEETKSELKADFKNRSMKLTNEDIISNCIVFFIAGYETTATFIQFTLYSLAVNPNIQQKLFEEINSYFEQHEKVEFDSLNSLPYLDAVCNEALRLYTPVTVFEHICGQDYKLGELVIEKGVIINLPLYAMHRDPESFPNPHQFIPERFLPENKNNIKPYSFIPFALGPRLCIGNRFSNYHSKLFLANFVKNFEVIKTKNTMEKIEYTGRFVVLSCKPLISKICRRR